MWDKRAKFRGKSTDTGEWIKGTGFCGIDCVRDFAGGKSAVWIFTGIPKSGIGAGAAAVSCLPEYAVSIDPESFGRYSGTEDLFGNEIYEGDILSWKDDEDTYFFEVAVANGMFVVKIGNTYDKDPLCDMLICDDLRVVGNIFDNPELVKRMEEQK